MLPQLVTEGSWREPNLRHISLIKWIVMQQCHFLSLVLLGTSFLSDARESQQVTAHIALSAILGYLSDLFPPPRGSWAGSKLLYSSLKGKPGDVLTTNHRLNTLWGHEGASFQPCTCQALHELRSCAGTSERLSLSSGNEHF